MLTLKFIQQHQAAFQVTGLTKNLVVLQDVII